jgi:ABC-type branched-subunit amino acid transport system ATPase component
MKCIPASTQELTPEERTRVAIARALVREPELLLVDELAATQSPTARDELRDLLRSLNADLGVAIMAASETLGVLTGFRRLFSIGNGQLISSDREGAVVEFPSRSDHRRAGRQ